MRFRSPCSPLASGGFASGQSLVAALALGAQGIHCGTAFLATGESFAHPYHKGQVVSAGSEETVFTDVFAINWPPRSPVRVIANSIIRALDDRLLGHDPASLPREVIAHEDGRPIYKYSTDSPIRTTAGDLEALAQFAGQGAGQIQEVRPAGEAVSEIVRSAGETLMRLGIGPG